MISYRIFFYKILHLQTDMQKLRSLCVVHNRICFDIFFPIFIACRHQPHFSRLANWEGIEKVTLLYNFIFVMRNARSTHFLALSPTLTFLLSEIHVGLTILCGIHFENLVPTWIPPNKRVCVRVLKRKCQ